MHTHQAQCPPLWIHPHLWNGSTKCCFFSLIVPCAFMFRHVIFALVQQNEWCTYCVFWEAFLIYFFANKKRALNNSSKAPKLIVTGTFGSRADRFKSVGNSKLSDYIWYTGNILFLHLNKEIMSARKLTFR